MSKRTLRKAYQKELAMALRTTKRGRKDRRENDNSFVAAGERDGWEPTNG
ncbi:hypothetical protein Hena1_00460 [Erwinia phage Hena1]|jgi:hypothetical protein|uniref:Uncharacterized protein n=1 Tax=Erwinia phage Hena1 TaxID=2678601 RepID=A0A6B9JC87_9CAUD|nr:hypothetical protein HWC84_gp045 [Erwinia phage Hena1]QGZ16222.1 hypothetical protein Hena1_00460 [Erwinia phage Hena1]